MSTSPWMCATGTPIRISTGPVPGRTVTAAVDRPQRRILDKRCADSSGAARGVRRVENGPGPPPAGTFVVRGGKHIGLRRRLRQDLGVPTIRIAQDEAADELLSRDPLALVVGMLLAQQFPMERDFAGKRLIADRIGVETLAAAALAQEDPEKLAKVFQGPPAVHRYPGSMAARTQELCRLLVERYGGRAENLWAEVPDGATLGRRVGELPGFGAQKSKIFLALLGKQYGVTPPGWRAG